MLMIKNILQLLVIATVTFCANAATPRNWSDEVLQSNTKNRRFVPPLKIIIPRGVDVSLLSIDDSSHLQRTVSVHMEDEEGNKSWWQRCCYPDCCNALGFFTVASFLFASSAMAVYLTLS